MQSKNRSLYRSFWNYLKKARYEVLALLLFVLLSLLYWWPLPLHLTSQTFEQLPHDSAFTQWIIAWDVHSLFHYPWKFFEANIYYPLQHSLAWGDNLFGIALLSVPFLPFLGLVGTYNFLLLISSAASAFACFLLIRSLTNNYWTGIILGTAWAFSFFRLLSHWHIIIMLPAFPLALFFLDKYRTTNHRKNLWWFGLSALAIFITNIYIMLYTLIALCLLIVILYLFKKLTLTQVVFLGGTLLAAILVATPLYLPSFILNLRHPTIRSDGDQNITGLDRLMPLPFPVGSNRGQEHLAIRTLGVFSLITWLASLGFIASLLVKKTREGLGEWKVPLSFFITGAIGTIAALGPSLTWGTSTFSINPIHKLFYFLVPAYSVLRVPSRWLIFSSLLIIVASGYFLAHMLKKVDRRSQAAFTLIAICWLIFEQFPSPLKTYPSYKLSDYPSYQWLASQKGEFPILEFPVYPGKYNYNNDTVEGRRIYLSTFGWKKKVTGAFSPYVPRAYDYNIGTINALGDDPHAIGLLREWGVKYIFFIPDDFKILGYSQDLMAKKKEALDTMPGIVKEKDFKDATVYRIVY